MFSRLIERKTHIHCDTVHGAIVGLLQQTLLQSQPTVTLMGRMSGPHKHNLAQQSASHNFRDVVKILTESGWLPSGNNKEQEVFEQSVTGTTPLSIPHPEQALLDWKSRINLSQVSPVAAMLRAFMILRVRYQRIGPQLPTVRIEAQHNAPSQLDTLYLLGDVFSERFNVRATFHTEGTTVTLKLVGAARLSDKGLSWSRSLYLLTRDVSVLCQPLREALESSHRPLVVPRMWTTDDEVVRVRLPHSLQQGDHALGWLPYLQQIFETPESSPIDPTKIDEVGSHWSATLAAHQGRSHQPGTSESGNDTAYVLWKRPDIPDEFIHVPFRAQAQAKWSHIEESSSQENTEKLLMSMEPLGGASEIAANGYYYRMGHKGLLIDAGVDANRNGWLGIPELERIDQLDVMILTHAHLDHMGALPIVLHAFPKLPVYCTRATRDILLPLLHDTVKIGGFRFQKTGEAPLISRDMVNALDIERFRCIEPGESYDIPEIPGLCMKVHNAGHIMGSIAVELRLSEWHLLHTGDFSTFPQHSLKAFDASKIKATHVVMEGTYSGRPQFDRAERRRNLNAFIEALHQAIDEHRCVLIPSFSVGRSQEMVSLIVEALQKDPTTATVPVYTVGMINRINALSCAVPEFFREGYVDRVRQAEALKVDLNPRYTREDQRAERYREAFAQIAEQGPAVVVSSHGMMAEGTGSFSISAAILNQNPQIDRIFMCGYMDPRTPGSRLKRRAQYPDKIPFGASLSVSRKAADACIQEFSITSHASYEELTDLALSTAKETLTLIHGDGHALRSLAETLHKKFSSQGRNVEINVPTNGERVSLGTASLPDVWDVSASDASRDIVTSQAGSSLSHRRTQLRIFPLVRSFGNAWLVIPVGQESTDLIIEHDVDFAKVLYAGAYRNNMETFEESWVLHDASDEEDAIHTAASSEQRTQIFTWSAIDEIELRVEVSRSYGQIDETTFHFSVVAELQPQRYALDAHNPVLLLKVGGTGTPQLDRLVEVDERYKRKREWAWQDVRWDPVRRELQITLHNQNEIGRIERLQVWLRWSSGYLQKGPAIGPFSMNPRVMLTPPQQAIQVGQTSNLTLYNFPVPGMVQLQHGDASLVKVKDLQLRPTHSGSQALHCLYRDRHNNLVRWPIATLSVAPGAKVRWPTTKPIGSLCQIEIQAVTTKGVKGQLTLTHDDKESATFSTSDLPWTWEESIYTAGPHSFRLEAQDHDGIKLVLWTGNIEIQPHPMFDWDTSCCVTTTNGKLQAQLVWDNTNIELQTVIAQASQQQGFQSNHWQENTLSFQGTPKTLGVRYLNIKYDTLSLQIPVVTLPSLQLLQEGGGPISAHPTPITPGVTLRFGTTDGPLPNAWFRVETGVVMQEGLDRPLLRMTAERITPFFDDLSCSVREGSATLLLSGHYKLSLWAGPQEIHEEYIEISPATEARKRPSRRQRRRSTPQTLVCSHKDTFLTSLSHSITSHNIPQPKGANTKQTPHPHAMFAHRLEDGTLSYELLVADSSALSEALWDRLSKERKQDNPVAVLYPGQTLPSEGIELLTRSLQQKNERITHLIHPIPWGEVVADIEQARQLRSSGVHVALPQESTITTNDRYQCPSCKQPAQWTTNKKDVYLQCDSCKHQIASPQLSLTLQDFRKQGADILFAPYEAANFLWFGEGQRYLTRFANMSSVPMPFCHSEKEREVVSHHLANLSVQWSLQEKPHQKVEGLVLAAATELGWNHPLEIKELFSLVTLTASMWRPCPKDTQEFTVWNDLYDEVLALEIPVTHKPASLIILELERLWVPTSFGRVRPMQEGIAGMMQWLDFLR